MPNEELPEWLDKTEVSYIGVVTMDDGQHISVEIVELDEENREVILDVLHPSRSHVSSLRGRQAIPVDRIVSFEPQPRAAQVWPHSDPCKGSPFSIARFSLMTVLFLSMTAGGIFLFVTLATKRFGLQMASAIVYTIFEVFFSFAAVRSWHRYLFTCPAVVPQVPRLLLRHLGFAIALVVFQTAALAVRLDMPQWWNVRGSNGQTPFETVIFFICIALGYAQVVGNRSVLERAHQEFSRNV